MLETMPFDKVFELMDGSQEMLHATGREVYIGGGDDYDDPASWYNEYGPDSEGECDMEGNIYISHSPSELGMIRKEVV